MSTEIDMSEPSVAYCQILPQSFEHTPVTIHGTREALLMVSHAIHQAISTGMDARTGSLFQPDGEGFHVEVRVRHAEYMAEQPTRYYRERP